MSPHCGSGCDENAQNESPSGGDDIRDRASLELDELAVQTVRMSVDVALEVVRKREKTTPPWRPSRGGCIKEVDIDRERRVSRLNANSAILRSRPNRGTFLLATRDQPGLVAQVSSFFYDRKINIVEAVSCSDAHSERGPRFFLRMSVDLADFGAGAEPAAYRLVLEKDFDGMASRLHATWSVGYSDPLARVAILVTREDSCLYDLVLRQRQGELPCDIPLIVSNHDTLGDVAERFGIPYHALPVTDAARTDQERQILRLLVQHRIDLVVLARYMQVMSEDFLIQAPPVINIHHGFLPAFQGARPYHQAYVRGVKLVGATAHYATRDLDQGPIIDQDVVRVDHRMGPGDLARVGRDVERVVLARAVAAHLERRVIVDGLRTIVL